MKISRLLEKLALIQLESGDREIVLSSGTEDFEIVAVAPPYLLVDGDQAPVLLELQAIDGADAVAPVPPASAIAVEACVLSVA